MIVSYVWAKSVKHFYYLTLNKRGTAGFNGFFYFIGNVFQNLVSLVRAAEQLNHCLPHKWDLLGNKGFYFTIKINGKCFLCASTNGAQLKITICWIVTLTSSLLNFYVYLHRLLSVGLIRGYGSWDHPSSAKHDSCVLIADIWGQVTESHQRNCPD